nr:LamG domain-containing protein [Candidatus Gracilibacteria bacterium]
GYSMTGGFDFIPNKLVVYSGSTQDLLQDSNKLILINNLKQAYINTIVQGEPTYKEIINTDTTSNQAGAITLVNNYLTSGVGGFPKVTQEQINNITQLNSCATQPTYTNATFITGTPTQINQAWQNTNNANPCYYACINGYTGSDCSVAPIICNPGEDGSSGVCKDPYWPNVSLAMHMDGTNGSTTFTDLKGNTITRYGNTSISTLQYKFGGSSSYFDGAGDYLRFPSATVPGTTQDFTIEMWIRIPAIPSGNVDVLTSIDDGGTYNVLNFELNTDKVGLYLRDGSATNYYTTALNSVPIAAWTHIALTRQGNTFRVFINGVKKLEQVRTFNLQNVRYWVGQDNTNIRDYIGYIDDYRITKGVARYTSNFTPPIQAFANQ